MNLLFCYSNVPNKRACTFISGKVFLLGSIKVRGQNLPEINVHARLFGTLAYLLQKSKKQVNFISLFFPSTPVSLRPKKACKGLVRAQKSSDFRIRFKSLDKI
jgi:hypothetical protein